jgi:SAM-dependent methyltransferase
MAELERAGFSSADYWERRYRVGGTSGAGSYGRLADYKASVINGFVSANQVVSVADFGCGDGNLLSVLTLGQYLGIDVSETTLRRCRVRFAGRPEMRFKRADLVENVVVELAMSVDVIFHLVEDRVFERYIRGLFAAASRYVLIYSSNVEARTADPHVRHRRFTAHVPSGWRLVAHLPNPYPFDPARPDDTSFADFFVFAAPSLGCTLHLPGARL